MCLIAGIILMAAGGTWFTGAETAGVILWLFGLAEAIFGVIFGVGFFKSWKRF